MQMKLFAAFTFITLIFTALPAAALDGAWTAAADEKKPGRLYLNISRGHQQQTGSTFDLSAFSGLRVSDIFSAAATPVRFAMRREAGTIDLEGTFRSGKGAGQLTFAPNRGYIDQVRSLGVEFELERKRSEEKRKRSEDETLFALALHDVSTDFIRAMQSEGFRVPLEKYLAMRIFNVTPEYIREMRSLGFNDLDADELIGTRIHRVTPQYVRSTRAAGWQLSLEELQSSRIHGVTPEYAAAMRAVGYELKLDDLLSFRIHGVTPEYIKQLRALGYANVDAGDLVSMRIHGVTPEFIRELKAAGYSGVPVEKLVSMRIHGVDAKFLTKMRDQ